MLVELDVMEQRYQAVLAVVQDGWKVAEVAAAPRGLAPERAHLDRPLRAGRPGGARRSLPPARELSRTRPTPETQALICELRREHPGWGPRRIEHQLGRLGVDPVPSRSAIYRCLKRHGLIELRRRRKRRDEFRRWERERPMQLWQMDVMGGVLLDDGTELKVVTGVDDHSRYCVAAGLVTRATSKAVCAVLSASLRRYGIPDEILTDNGKVFTGRFGPQPTEVLFDRICRENGISHRHTARALTDDHRQDRTVPPEPAQGVPRRSGPSGRSPRPRPSSTPGSPTTTPSGRTRHSRWRPPAERFGLAPITVDAMSVPVDTAEEHRGQWVLRRVGSNGVRLGRQPALLGDQRLQGRADRRVRRRHGDPGLEQEPPDPAPSLAPAPARFARSGPTALTSSSISRPRNVKHQVALDRGH